MVCVRRVARQEVLLGYNDHPGSLNKYRSKAKKLMKSTAHKQCTNDMLCVHKAGQIIIMVLIYDSLIILVC